MKDQCIFYPPSFHFVDKLNSVADNRETQINIRHPTKSDLSFMTDAPLPPDQFIQLVGPGGVVIQKYPNVKPGDHIFPKLANTQGNTYFVQLVKKDGTILISQKLKNHESK